jgi:hypothetical protein
MRGEHLVLAVSLRSTEEMWQYEFNWWRAMLNIYPSANTDQLVCSIQFSIVGTINIHIEDCIE